MHVIKVNFPGKTGVLSQVGTNVQFHVIKSVAVLQAQFFSGYFFAEKTFPFVIEFLPWCQFFIIESLSLLPLINTKNAKYFLNVNPKRWRKLTWITFETFQIHKESILLLVCLTLYCQKRYITKLTKQSLSLSMVISELYLKTAWSKFKVFVRA